jgi:hypothetical protein
MSFSFVISIPVMALLFGIVMKLFRSRFIVDGTYCAFFCIQVLNTSLVVGEMGKIIVLSMDGDYMYTIPYKPIVNMVRFIHRRSNDGEIWSTLLLSLSVMYTWPYLSTSTPRAVSVFEYSKIFLPSNVMQCTFFESVKIIESFIQYRTNP